MSTITSRTTSRETLSRSSEGHRHNYHQRQRKEGMTSLHGGGGDGSGDNTASTMSSFLTPIPTHSSCNELIDNDHTSRLQFDSSKIYGRQDEISILENAIKSMVKSQRNRRVQNKDTVSDTGESTETKEENIHGRNDNRNDDVNSFNEVQQTEVETRQRQEHEEEEGNEAVLPDKSKNQKQLILISGYAGAGKSVLAHSIRDLVENEMGGTFVSGKFDQHLGAGGGGGSSSERSQTSRQQQKQQHRPYRAFQMICGELVKRIVQLKTATNNRESRKLFEWLKDQLMMELGTELMDLIQVFPSLDGLLSTSHQYTLDDSTSYINAFNDGDDEVSIFNLSNEKEERHQERRQRNVCDNVVNPETRYRFKFIFNILFRILISVLSPTVIIIDDLQWSDAASLDLLDSLVSNNDIQNITFICTSRSNSETIDETANLVSKTIRDIRSSSYENNTSIIDINIGNLNLNAVHEMLSSILSSSSIPSSKDHQSDDDDDTKKEKSKKGNIKNRSLWPLAEICYKKTLGNPFYLIHFVSRLHALCMLRYDIGSNTGWVWEKQQIEQYTEVTENVIDLLKQSMVCLSSDHQMILKFASFLGGATFEERPIYILWKDHRKRSTRKRERKDKIQKSSMDSRIEENDATVTTNDTIEIGSEGGTIITRKTTSEDEDDGNKIEDITLFKSVVKSCQEAGFWERVEGRKMYRWGHDKLQEAAMNLVDQKERRDFNQYVAEVLTNHLNDRELEALMFVLVDRFNEGNVPAKRSKRIDLATLNLQAADKAVSYSAFESAASYCKYGIRLLPVDCWERDYDLSLKLYSLGAETEGFLGNADTMEEYCNEVLRQKVVGTSASTSRGGRIMNTFYSWSGNTKKLGDKNGTRGGIRDKFRVYNVMMLSIANRNLPKEASKICLDVLGRYGMKFPTSTAAITCRIAINIVKMKSSIKSRTSEDIENLPIMDDPILIEQMALLDKLSTYTFLTHNNLFPLVLFKMLDWTMECGCSKYAPVAFATNAIILAGVLGDLSGGRLYAKFSLQLLNKLDTQLSREVQSRTMLLVHGFVLHWTTPLQHMLSIPVRAYEIGLQNGDVESAMLNIYLYMLFGFVSGVTKLQTIERDCKIYILQMKKLKQEVIMIQSKMLHQFILNLTGQINERQDETKLSGEAFVEETYKKELTSTPLLAEILELHKMTLYMIFKEYKNAGELAYTRGDRLHQLNPGPPFIALDTFHRCLSLIGAAKILKDERMKKDTGKKRQREESLYIKSAKTALVKIRSWTDQSNPQSQHYKALVEAELAAYQDKSINIVQEQYKTAIQMAAENGFIQDVALANERYGEYLLSQSEVNYVADKCTEPSSDGLMEYNDVSSLPKNTVIPDSKHRPKISEAKMRIRESIRNYREWGADVKAMMLEDQYSTLVGPSISLSSS